MFAMADGVVNQVVEHFLKKRICIDLDGGQINGDEDLAGIDSCRGKGDRLGDIVPLG